MGKTETFADYAQNIREAMSDQDLDGVTLAEMRDAFAEAMIRQPDWFYHAQGIERDDLADLKPVEDPVAAEGARATFAVHGLLPTETVPGMAYVIGEDGTVYHRDPDLSDARLTGDIYTLRDLTNRAAAVTTRGHVEDGNVGEALADIGGGAFLAGGTGTGKAAARARPTRDRFASDGDYQHYRSIMERGYPMSFKSREEAAAVGNSMRDRLKEAGFDDVTVGVRGSAVTGRAYNPATGLYDGRKFTPPGKQKGKEKPSDIDYAVASPKLYERAAAEFDDRKNEKGWVGPLGKKELESIGLEGLLPSSASTKTSIMIYRNGKTLRDRGPWMPLGE